MKNVSSLQLHRRREIGLKTEPRSRLGSRQDVMVVTMEVVGAEQRADFFSPQLIAATPTS